MKDCPAITELEQLISGSLAEPAAGALREHLDGCPRCLGQLDRLSDDDELREWRRERTATVRQVRAEAGVARLLGRLRSWSTWNAAEAETDQGGRGPDLVLAPSDHPGDLGMLGPYRVRRELGRGGMGIVLEAFDTELRRDAAIKVLRPDRADDKSRARFVREAQAAARVKHEHVVTIHAVSNPADALPYLVMELVRGPTLREMIAAEKRLDPRATARIIAEIADGLAAAHEAGLVHRDIKPSNILLEDGSRQWAVGSSKENARSPERTSDRSPYSLLPTAYSLPKLSDFGLARITELASSLTHDGTLAGTPAYMSPEQVRNPETIDPRADVYSLGVTLYESLTGEVPFGGAAHMVLRQIETDEPRAPRRLNDAVPRDLETICLKAMEKDAARRYQSAREFGDDLRRWLGGEPIAARPISSAERLWRWCRRNPRVAGLSAAVFALMGLIAAGSMFAAVRIAQEQARTKRESDAAVAARIDADKNAADADAARRQAESSAQSAIEQRALALEAHNNLIFGVQDLLGAKPGTLKIRQQLLEKALPGLEKIIAGAEQNQAADHSLITAHLRLGEVLWYLGRTDRARELYERSRQLAEGMLAVDRSDNQIRRDLAGACDKLGVIAQHSLNLPEARIQYERSLELRLAAAEQDPKNAEVRREVAWAHSRLGDVAYIEVNYAKAEMEFGRALQLTSDLAQADPTNTTLQRDRYSYQRRLGWALEGQQKLDAAAECYAQAIELAAPLLASDRENLTWQRDVMLVRSNLGNLELTRGRADVAEPILLESLQGFEQIAASDPDNAEFQYDVVTVLYRVGAAQLMQGDAAACRETHRRRMSLLEDLVQKYPSTTKFRNNLAAEASTMCNFEIRFGDFESAEKFCRRAVEVGSQLDVDGLLVDPNYQAAKRWFENRLCAFPLLTQALEDVRFAMSQPREVAVELYLLRAQAFVLRGDVVHAAESAALARTQLGDDQFERVTNLHILARLHALIAAAARKRIDSDSVSPHALAFAELHSQTAINLLRETLKVSNETVNVSRIDPDFAALRDHSDYLKLLKESVATGSSK